MRWLAVAALLSACGSARPPPKKAARPVVQPRTLAVDEVGPVDVGGVQQWIFARGERADAPVLLWLHGGPGYPETPFAHVYGEKLEAHFVVVHWHQRGAGRSWAPDLDPDQMTIDRFVKDCVEITEHLRARFGVDRVVLVGHSWGTVIGLKAVQLFPELYSAWIGIGHSISVHRGETLSYHWTLDMARQAENIEAIKALEALGLPPYGTGSAQIDGVTLQRRWAAHFGGMLYGETGYDKLEAITARTTPRYRATSEQIRNGVRFSLRTLWPQVLGVDLLSDSPPLHVPLFLLSGRMDYATPWELVERWYERVDARAGKQLIWFHESAHFPHLEEPDRFAEVLTKRVLPSISD